MLYDTFSWQSNEEPGDDSYVDRVAELIDAIAAQDAEAVADTRRRLGEQKLPMQPVAQLPASVATNGELTRNPASSVIQRVFERDGYRCRYCGTRAIAPAVLAAAHEAGRSVGDALPCHPNWKRDETDPVYFWQFATLEHVHPVSRGGSWDDEANLVTACWPCQARKRHYLLEELGWILRPVERGDWDGLLSRLEALQRVLASGGESEAPVVSQDANEPPRDGGWVVVSFHATMDGRDGALVAAAVIDQAPAAERTTRGAYKTRWSPTGEYTSINGRWRVRRPTAEDLETVGREPGPDAAWLLEVWATVYE